MSARNEKIAELGAIYLDQLISGDSIQSGQYKTNFFESMCDIAQDTGFINALRAIATARDEAQMLKAAKALNLRINATVYIAAADAAEASYDEDDFKPDKYEAYKWEKLDNEPKPA